MENWIKINRKLPDSPKIYQLSRRINRSEGDVFFAVTKLWFYADIHADTSGRMEISLKKVEEITGEKKLPAALIAIGWLAELEDGSVQLPEFDKYNGKNMKAREAERARKEAYRRRKREEGKRDIVPDEGGTMSHALNGTLSHNKPGHCPENVPSETGQARDTIEEEEEEDSNIYTHTTEESVHGNGKKNAAGSAGVGVDYGVEMSKALAFAASIGIQATVVEAWHDAREAGGWLNSMGNPIRKWQPDLRGFDRNWKENRAGRTARPGTPDPSKHGTPNPERGW